ncbi:MAG: hemerythrin family protein [Eubacteriales bacterium]|nr:hemerythrin family protein [Eubacteriales bacterium]
MEQIREDFRTGMEELDEEHVVLLDLTEQVRKLLEDENMLFKCADIRGLLKRLIDYTAMHFAHEEELMESMGYDGLESQKQQHRLFVGRLEDFREQVSQLSIGTQDDMIRELFDYLQKWLHEHIKKEDMKYAEFATAKAEGNC